MLFDGNIDKKPNMKVSCGWPHKAALAKRIRRIGECWSPGCSTQKTTEIFISPYLEDPAEVLATLVHEMCHAAVGVQVGHKGIFRKMALRVGLTGKMTATQAGDELKGKLARVIDRLGPYPHGKLDLSTSTNGDKKQKTRYHLVKCPDCGYQVRVTQKWIEIGMPACPCGQIMEAKGVPEI